METMTAAEALAAETGHLRIGETLGIPVPPEAVPGVPAEVQILHPEEAAGITITLPEAADPRTGR